MSMHVYFNKIIFSIPRVIYILEEDRKLIYGHMDAPETKISFICLKNNARNRFQIKRCTRSITSLLRHPSIYISQNHKRTQCNLFKRRRQFSRIRDACSLTNAARVECNDRILIQSNRVRRELVERWRQSAIVATKLIKVAPKAT